MDQASTETDGSYDRSGYSLRKRVQQPDYTSDQESNSSSSEPMGVESTFDNNEYAAVSKGNKRKIVKMFEKGEVKLGEKDGSRKTQVAAVDLPMLAALDSVTERDAKRRSSSSYASNSSDQHQAFDASPPTFSSSAGHINSPFDQNHRSSFDSAPANSILSALFDQLPLLLNDMRLEATQDVNLQVESQRAIESSIALLPTRIHRTALCLAMNRYSAFAASPAIDVPAFPITASKVALFISRALPNSLGAHLRSIIPSAATFPLPFVGGTIALDPSEGLSVTRDLVGSWTEALAYAQGSSRAIWENVMIDGAPRELMENAAIVEMLRTFEDCESIIESRNRSQGFRSIPMERVISRPPPLQLLPHQSMYTQYTFPSPHSSGDRSIQNIINNGQAGLGTPSEAYSISSPSYPISTLPSIPTPVQSPIPSPFQALSSAQLEAGILPTPSSSSTSAAQQNESTARDTGASEGDSGHLGVQDDDVDAEGEADVETVGTAQQKLDADGQDNWEDRSFAAPIISHQPYNHTIEFHHPTPEATQRSSIGLPHPHLLPSRQLSYAHPMYALNHSANNQPSHTDMEALRQPTPSAPIIPQNPFPMSTIAPNSGIADEAYFVALDRPPPGLRESPASSYQPPDDVHSMCYHGYYLQHTGGDRDRSQPQRQQHTPQYSSTDSSFQRQQRDSYQDQQDQQNQTDYQQRQTQHQHDQQHHFSYQTPPNSSRFLDRSGPSPLSSRSYLSFEMEMREAEKRYERQGGGRSRLTGLGIDLAGALGPESSFDSCSIPDQSTLSGAAGCDVDARGEFAGQNNDAEDRSVRDEIARYLGGQ